MKIAEDLNGSAGADNEHQGLWLGSSVWWCTAGLIKAFSALNQLGLFRIMEIPVLQPSRRDTMGMNQKQRMILVCRGDPTNYTQWHNAHKAVFGNAMVGETIWNKTKRNGTSGSDDNWDKQSKLRCYRQTQQAVCVVLQMAKHSRKDEALWKRLIQTWKIRIP